MDWNEIKIEYISSDISYRDLAAKHGVSNSTLGRQASKGGWKRLRDDFRNDVAAKSVQKNEAHAVERMERIQKLADCLVGKIELAIAQLDSQGEVDRAGLRQITAAIRDIMEIQGLRAEPGEEQETGVALIPPVSAEEMA